MRYKSTDADEGYLKRKLAQLAEESRPIKDDPLAGRPHFESKEDNEIIDELLKKVEGSKFEYEHQRQIQWTRIPKSAPKHARDIALDEPWTGEESLEDASLRMLTDKYKPLKGSSNGSVPMPKRKPSISRSRRLAEARDGAIDYKLDKDVTDSPVMRHEGPSRKEMIEEKLFGPAGASMFMSSGGSLGSFSAIGSLADRRIEDAIARGQFENLPRGEKQTRDTQAMSAHVDTTEYILNNMIKRQGGAPPWIMKQTQVNELVDDFRRTLRKSWVSRATTIMLDETAGMPLQERIAHARRTASSISQSAWKADNASYHEAKVKDINSSIRGYNLQAPGAARRGYIDLDKELQRCYEDAVEEIPVSLENHLVGPPTRNIPVHNSASLHREAPENYYGFSHLAKDVWKKVWRR